MRKEGNNPYNNRVIVDYEKKTINFMPVGKKSIKKYYLIFLGQISAFYLIMFYALACILILMEFMLELKLSALVMWDAMALTIGAIVFSLSYFDKKWRKKHFPQLNAKLVKLMRKILMRKTHKMIINDKAMIGNKFIIPEFSNVELKYKTTQDYSKYLKKITIMNIIKANPWEWNCVFEFKKKPLKGYLEIEYT